MGGHSWNDCNVPCFEVNSISSQFIWQEKRRLSLSIDTALVESAIMKHERHIATAWKQTCTLYYALPLICNPVQKKNGICFRMICLNSSATTTSGGCSGQCKQGQASLRILARQQRRHSFKELKSISSSCSTQWVSWHIAKWEEMPNKKKVTGGGGGGRSQTSPGGILDVLKRLIAFQKLFDGFLEAGNWYVLVSFLMKFSVWIN